MKASGPRRRVRFSSTAQFQPTSAAQGDVLERRKKPGSGRALNQFNTPAGSTALPGCSAPRLPSFTAEFPNPDETYLNGVYGGRSSSLNKRQHMALAVFRLSIAP